MNQNKWKKAVKQLITQLTDSDSAILAFYNLPQLNLLLSQGITISPSYSFGH